MLELQMHTTTVFMQCRCKEKWVSKTILGRSDGRDREAGHLNSYTGHTPLTPLRTVPSSGLELSHLIQVVHYRQKRLGMYMYIIYTYVYMCMYMYMYTCIYVCMYCQGPHMNVRVHVGVRYIGFNQNLQA